MPLSNERLVEAIRAHPDVIPFLTGNAKALAKMNGLKQFQNYDALRSDYWARIYDTVYAYLDGSKPITLYRNSIQNLVTDYFQEACEIGYEDGGATLPLDDATQGLLDSMISEQKDFVGNMFESLRDNSIEDYAGEAYARADVWSSTLDAAYNLGKMAAVGNQMLTFDGDDGKESCDTCKRLKGQRHRASWWIDNDLLPSPGNENFDCKGYNCQHGLFDDEGNQFTQ